MAKLTKKSQTARKPKCRDCYIDMGVQLDIEGNEDWLCSKCGRRWPKTRTEAVNV